MVTLNKLFKKQRRYDDNFQIKCFHFDVNLRELIWTVPYTHNFQIISIENHGSTGPGIRGATDTFEVTVFHGTHHIYMTEPVIIVNNMTIDFHWEIGMNFPQGRVGPNKFTLSLPDQLYVTPGMYLRFAFSSPIGSDIINIVDIVTKAWKL